MSYIEALIFGIVQGITEFLPISSTAHIIIVQHLLGYRFPGLAFEIFLHLASVLAVITYYWRDLLQVASGFFAYFRRRTEANRTAFLFGLYLLIATVLTGGLGMVLKNILGDDIKSPLSMAAALAATGMFLLFIERFRRYGGRKEQDMTFKDAVIVGLGQTVSVLPGISRSGATLITALWRGLDRETAVRYSFLLAVPVILGSSVLAIEPGMAEVWSLIGAGPLVLAFAATFVFSMLGIVWLIRFLRDSKLIYFAVYCLVAAVLIALFLDPAAVTDL